MSTERRALTIVSGGQTGVDRGALDAAIDLNIPCGGWCPKGRLAEDGLIGSRYALKETPSADYDERTRWNVRDSDATLVLTIGEPTGGTAYTIEVARRTAKPHLVIDLGTKPSVDDAALWARAHQVRILNVAGPRESKSARIYADTYVWCIRLFTRLR